MSERCVVDWYTNLKLAIYCVNLKIRIKIVKEKRLNVFVSTNKVLVCFVCLKYTYQLILITLIDLKYVIFI